MHKFIFLLILCFGAAAAAQDAPPQRQPELTLSVGAAFALGSFSSTSFDRDYPAFAGTGSLFKLNYTRSIRPNLGLGATAGYRRNPFREGKFAHPEDELVQELKSKPWQTAYVLADVQFQVPLGSSGLTYIRGSLGGAFNRSASLQVQTPFGTITRSSDTSFALAYGASTGLKAEQNRFMLGVETSLLYMRPAFEAENQQGDINRYKQHMNSVNFTIGVGYKL